MLMMCQLLVTDCKDKKKVNTLNTFERPRIYNRHSKYHMILQRTWSAIEALI